VSNFHTQYWGTYYFYYYCLSSNLRRVPVPVSEIGVGYGEGLEQFHIAINLGIVDENKHFGFFHDENAIEQTDKQIISIRLFRH